MSGLLPAVGGAAKLSIFQVAAGALSGLVAMSGLIAAGIVPGRPQALAAKPLALVGCPGGGSVVAVAQPGEQMLVTGRNVDGSWLRVYVPAPASQDGWVPATSVELLADGSSLPVAGCGEVAPATGTPGPTATATLANPSASPTATPRSTAKPTPTPAPTPTPTLVPTAMPNPGPVLANLRASTGTIYYAVAGSPCVPSPTSTTITVSATDPQGVATVSIYWRYSGSGTYAHKPMTKSGRTWSAPLATGGGDNLRKTGSVQYYVIAVDGDGAQTRSPSGTKDFKVRPCNLPPIGINFSTNTPYLYVGCHGSMTVTVTAYDPDPDGITSVQMVYTPVGGQQHSLKLPLKLTQEFYGIYEATLTDAYFPTPAFEGPFPYYIAISDAFGATTKYDPGATLLQVPCSP
jgi:hypothetical protein